MGLKDFISEALTQIIQGIDSANKTLDGIDATINPRDVSVENVEHSQLYGWLNDDETFYRPVEKVKFDVAVTATKGKETKGGVGVVVGTFAIGSQGKSDQGKTSVSRLQFEIPIVYPNGEVKIEK